MTPQSFIKGISMPRSTESADFLQLGIYHYQVAGQLARKVSAAEKAIEAKKQLKLVRGSKIA